MPVPYQDHGPYPLASSVDRTIPHRNRGAFASPTGDTGASKIFGSMPPFQDVLRRAWRYNASMANHISMVLKQSIILG